MNEKTPGIVLKQIRYSDSSRIVHIYTRHRGRLAFMVKGIGRKKGRFSPAWFQPLTLLELEISYRSARSLQTLHDAHLALPLPEIHGNIVKTSLALFLSELLYRTLEEEEPNPSLYTFLQDEILRLEAEKDPGSFHLFFLAGLTRHLGFSPSNRFSDDTPFFDLREGLFVSTPPAHQDLLDTHEARLFSLLLDGEPPVVMSTDYKKRFLEKLLLYYHIHLEGMGPVRSLEILHHVFH